MGSISHAVAQALQVGHKDLQRMLNVLLRLALRRANLNEKREVNLKLLRGREFDLRGETCESKETRLYMSRLVYYVPFHLGIEGGKSPRIRIPISVRHGHCIMITHAIVYGSHQLAT